MGNSSWPEALPRAGNQRLAQVESISPWFEIRQVNNDTFALLEPRHYEEVISYLIIGDERAVLFDTGMGIANMKMEVERLTPLPVVVVNSHSHYDHIGGNHAFDDVWVFDNEYEIARIERGYSAVECQAFMSPNSYLDLPLGFVLTTYEIQPARITRRLHHLDTIELGNRDLIVHHTPGETPGSVCLLDSRHDILFTGDIFYLGTLWAHLENFDAYRRSLKYLVSLSEQIRHLCPAHNVACVSKEMLKLALDGFEQIAARKVEPEAQGEARLYRFGGFNVRLLPGTIAA